ncbi:response regulator [Cohnella sp. WQ 127256]|uniref:response regulator n=1 Tax=Cohnella sp. WQ 127256 TaxID=2938790 RepID=UPI002117C3E1|nr:response regulator [Cohnella sp. WQ 127256]
MTNVLIVDDEWLVRQGLITLMPWDEYGMKVIGEANDGEEALIAASENVIDLMFVDLTMPVMDGFELMREMHIRYPAVKIVVLTCHQDFDYLQEAMRLGAIDYIVKTKLVKDKMDEALHRISSRINFDRSTVPASQAAQTSTSAIPLRGYLLLSLDQISGIEQLFGISWLREEQLIRIREGTWFLPRSSSLQEDKEVNDFLYGGQGPSWVLIKVYDDEGKHIEQMGQLLLSYVEEEWYYLFRPLMQVYTVSLSSSNLREQAGRMSMDLLAADWRSFYWLFDDNAYGQGLRHFQSMGSSRLQAWQFITMIGEEYAEMFRRNDYHDLLATVKTPFPTWHHLETWLLQTRMKLSKLLAEIFSVEIIRNITKAVVYLEHNLSERINQDEIAGIASMSRSYFSVCFKNVLQQTFSDFLRDKRLKRAMLLLLETDEPIQWISAKTGFMDEKYFSKVFRNKTGMLPTAYRKQLRDEARMQTV